MTMPADLSTRAQQCAVQICRDVAELPDYTSPEYQPDVMLCTAEELSIIVERAFAEHASQAVAAERERCASIVETDYRSDLAKQFAHEPQWWKHCQQLAALIRSEGNTHG